MIIRNVKEFIQQVENITDPHQQYLTEVYIGSQYYCLNIGRLYIKKISMEKEFLVIQKTSNRIIKVKILEGTIFKIKQKVK